jgi:hypothetical protein
MKVIKTRMDLVRIGIIVSFLLALSLFCTIPYANTLTEGVTNGDDPETGLRFWRWEAEGVLFELTQLLPDQTRGFFEARGFEPTVADEIARACVFQSNFKNIAAPGGGAIRIDLKEWRITTDNDTGSMLVREYWNNEWSDHTVSQAARIALEWSLLPTRQQYAPGDYNWGMTAYGLSPGTKFNLEFRWERENQQIVRTIEDIECAPDIHLNPQ